jgi:dienelactone hydrolase
MLLTIFLSIITHATALKNLSFILPQGTGPLRSTLTISELVDKSRVDPFNASHVRRIMLSRFDPVAPKSCNLTQVPYFTPATAAAENEILAAYEFPKILGGFALEVCEKRERGSGNGVGGAKFPVVVFSPGLNTTRLFYSSLAQEIASHGFVTITVDHPYDVDVVEFPNGDVVFGGRVSKPVNGSTASVEHALEVRARDVSFVLDTLGIGKQEKVVMVGQSFGGAAAATSMLHDKRIRAGVNLDGTMFGPVLRTPLGDRHNKQSFLLWGSSGHNTTSDEAWGQFWNTLQQSPDVDYAKELSLVNSSHGSHWDLNIMVDVAGIRDELSEVAQLLVSPVPGARVWEITGRYLPSFFRFALGQGPEDVVFKGPSSEFPEVEILRSKH